MTATKNNKEQTCNNLDASPEVYTEKSQSPKVAHYMTSFVILEMTKL